MQKRTGVKTEMRLFTAVNFSEDVKEEVACVLDRLRGYGVKGSFTRRENLHLTVVFIGETSRIEAVRQAMDSLCIKPFVLEIGGLGSFRRPGGEILWLGIKHNPNLLAVHNQLCLELNAAGVAVEKRAYKPHLTLAREVILPKDFEQGAFAKTIPPLRLPVTKISLMKSARIAGKLTYTGIYTAGQ